MTEGYKYSTYVTGPCTHVLLVYLLIVLLLHSVNTLAKSKKLALAVAELTDNHQCISELKEKLRYVTAVSC